ncbi:hypothetical protein QE152_g15198, partial [Popillia japonica]
TIVNYLTEVITITQIWRGEKDVKVAKC